MFRILSVVVLLITIVGQQVMASEELCPDKAHLQEGIDDMRMQEDEFTLERALESVIFLQVEFSERIWGPEPTTDFSAWSGHYISYANSLKFIEGALLKQQVYLELARARGLSGDASNGAVKLRIENDLDAAKKKFCDFLKTAEYVD